MRTQHITEQNPSKGIFICLLAYFFVSLIGICEKFISSGISVPVILLFQNVICLVMLTPDLIKNRISAIKKEHLNTYAIRIGSGLSCYAALFYLIRFMPISEAFLYQYSASLWVPFIMFIWLNNLMPKQLWYGILVGFVGIILILKPTSATFGIVSLVGLACGILQGISVVAIRKLCIVEPLHRIMFYNFFIGTIVSSVLVINHWSPIEFHDFLWLIGVGVSTYIAQKFLTTSLKYANPTTLAPMCYASILFSGLLGWLIWNEAPDSITMLGMLLVICGCLLSVLISAGIIFKPRTTVTA